MEKFTIEIANYFDQEDSIAEIYYDSLEYAEINIKDPLMLKIYAEPKRGYWELPLDEAIEALESAITQIRLRKNKQRICNEPPSKADEVNNLAQKKIEQIVNHPKREIIKSKSQRFGDIVDIYAPNSEGVRCTSDGDFIGFLEQ